MGHRALRPRWCILQAPGLASRRRARLSSNIRPRNTVSDTESCLSPTSNSFWNEKLRTRAVALGGHWKCEYSY